MRISSLLWLSMLSLGCGFKRMLPAGPVLTPAEQASFQQAGAAAVDYTSPARVAFPVLPLQVFGLQYAVDVVMISTHPDWDMHEFARLDVPGQSLWVAKDSDLEGNQTIVADAENLNEWLPEIPATRRQSPVAVTDRSDGNQIDLALSYTNPAGEPTQMWAKGRLPSNPPAKRNGSTMGHSREVVAAVLDLERFGRNLDGGININNQNWRMRKILGLIPMRFLLRQTQGGIATTNFRLTPAANGFSLSRPIPGTEDWPTQALEAWQVDGQRLQYEHSVCSFDARFIDGGLHQYTVYQKGIAHPSFQLHLNPALPDLRRRFTGTHTSRFRMDVGDQTGHGTGRIETRWVDENTVSVVFVPEAPWWLADRPMQGSIHFREDGAVDVQMSRQQPAEL